MTENYVQKIKINSWEKALQCIMDGFTIYAKGGCITPDNYYKKDIQNILKDLKHSYDINGPWWCEKELKEPVPDSVLAETLKTIINKSLIYKPDEKHIYECQFCGETSTERNFINHSNFCPISVLMLKANQINNKLSVNETE